MEEMILNSAVEIDKKRIEREARSSEHNEAYQPMWERDGIRIGVGARFIDPDETTFFIELVVPICTDSQVDLEILEGRLEILRRLEEETFSLTCQDDSSFCCELATRKNDIENEYIRAVSLVEHLLAG
jgi:hypothetical protein